MEGKRLAQVGAAAFVGLAIAMTLVQLREEPVSAPVLPLAGRGAGADALAMQLRACSAMGEQALSSPVCRAAWTEKRRRFFGAAPLPAPDRTGTEPTPDMPLPGSTASGSD
ncbi:putative entry exclusion protein TrbK-alt [Erythrobacter sp. NE805]|uniref:putative entry exclusion protein TrbK-alt n=1 Tax=Erythrobacter sp. NE805 TaxID=3389875 RepID=UPI00396AF25D